MDIQFTPTPTNYVAGFMFSDDLRSVALIRKLKPEWQRNKLNGVGGKVEPGEMARDAMIREFCEETGCHVEAHRWHHLVEMFGKNNDDGGDFRVDFYVTTGDLRGLQSPEAEKIEIVSLDAVWPGRGDMIENLPWLLGVALDFLQDGRPHFITAIYP